MTSISIDVARQDFDGLLAKVLSASEPVVVDAASGGSVVMMPLEEFSGWQETAYLLKHPANAAHLRMSILDVQQGRVGEHQLDEQ